MSKKLYIGLAVGTLIGIAVPVILKFKRDQSLFSDEDLSEEAEENSRLDEVNDYILRTRKKVNKMVEDAESKSNNILQEAGSILSNAKEKTSEIHYDIKETAAEELIKLKAEIEKSIEEFRKKLGSE